MATLEQIQQKTAASLSLLNQRIADQLTTSNPLMDSVVTHYLRTKGKQMRPLVVILTAGMFGQPNERTIASGAAVELLHNASLIHDDVVDNSKMRRNVPTINAIWDNHLAVLVGDFFVSSAMQQAISTGDVRIIDSLCHLGKLLSLGELDQIHNARYHSLTEDAYFHIIEYKTASLFVACARMGCYSVGADERSTATMAEFARLLGLCFQIRDDIFDYYPDEKVGKPTGNDLREGKVTLPLLHTLLDTTLPEQPRMLELSQKESLDDAEIATLTAYARNGGGIEYAYRKMHELRHRAAGLLRDMPAGENRDMLLDLLDAIIARDH